MLALLQAQASDIEGNVKGLKDCPSTDQWFRLTYHTRRGSCRYYNSSSVLLTANPDSSTFIRPHMKLAVIRTALVEQHQQMWCFCMVLWWQCLPSNGTMAGAKQDLLWGSLLAMLIQAQWLHPQSCSRSSQHTPVGRAVVGTMALSPYTIRHRHISTVQRKGCRNHMSFCIQSRHWRSSHMVGQCDRNPRKGNTHGCVTLENNKLRQ